MTKRKSPRGRARGARPERRAERARRPDASGAGEGPYWLFGGHAVLAALANPRRRRRRLLLGEEAARRHGARIEALLAKGDAREGAAFGQAEPADSADFSRFLPEGAVHQGLALLVEPLAQPALQDLLAAAPAEGAAARPVVVVLDQVTDPHNVGAVLRSASAFSVRAVITTKRHAPPESGTLAKAASGALEHLPYLRVTNLVRALESLKKEGFWCLGLSEDADRPLAEADPGGPVALVLGAEGTGLRRLTREICDLSARLPTAGPIPSLNVSNAAAVALYELLGRGG
jgi:23S rRNA (guanosine2251-2'-O)-methyltransferase